MRSSNPSLTSKTFEKFKGMSQGSSMTIEGTVNKTLFLLTLLIISATLTWMYVPVESFVIVVGVAIVGLVIAFIGILVPKTTPFLAPLYAVVEGILVGVVSKMYETQYDGIVLQAVLITVCIFVSLLFAYKLGLIKVTETFRAVVISATLGIALVYLATLVLRIFGMDIPLIHESGLVGIGFSLVVVVIASLNLVLDFDFIDRATKLNVPKYMEWYAGFSLLITLVWLYFEILNLLRKIYGRN